MYCISPLCVWIFRATPECVDLELISTKKKKKKKEYD